MCPKELALLVSKSGLHPVHKMGAVLVDKKKPIGLGFNHQKTHPIQKKFSCRGEHGAWLHAEIAAILAARTCPEGAHLYVARWLRSERAGDSKPCAGCMRYIKESKIAKITFYQDGEWITNHIT